MNNFFKNILLGLQTFFHPAKKSKQKISLDENSKVLFVNFGELEFSFATTALLNIIKEKTGCNITVLTEGKNKIVYEKNRDVDNLIIYEENNNAIKLLNGIELDVLINPHNNEIEELKYIVANINTKHKIGFNKKISKLYTHSVPTKNGLHIIDELLLLADTFDFKYTKENVNVKFKVKDIYGTEASSFMGNEIDLSRPIVGINISAGDENKFWGIDRYKRLIKYLSDFDVNVIILRYPIDNDKAEQITRSNSIIYKNTSLDEYAAIFKFIHFLFTPDSPAVQIASSKKIPMFILYNKKENAKKWCPYNSPYECVIAEAENFSRLSYGKVLNSFIPFFENFITERSNTEKE